MLERMRFRGCGHFAGTFRRLFVLNEESLACAGLSEVGGAGLESATSCL
jgi:hypothetical protein